MRPAPSAPRRRTTPSSALPLFPFVQLELPFTLGPADGRYMIRGPGGLASHIVVFETLGAPQKRALARRKRKPRPVDPEPEPTPVDTTRVTLVDAEPFESTDAAQQWQAKVDATKAAEEGIRMINSVLYAHRAASGDPHVHDVSREHALVVRVGMGEGEQVAEGRWTAAVALQPERTPIAQRRSAVLRPQERLAAILSGRDVALACEELTLRGRADLDAGRAREAALQLRVALEAAIAELAPWADRPRMGERIEKLKAERGVVGDAANRALEGGLDEETTKEVTRVLRLVEHALNLRMQTELG